LPTEWNHIEAALAYSQQLPLLVIHHRGIKRGRCSLLLTERCLSGRRIASQRQSKSRTSRRVSPTNPRAQIVLQQQSPTI
jgi:hypothetical protein